MATMKFVLKCVLVSAAVLGLQVAQPAAAHVLKKDNGVEVELHIPPDDTPKAGQPTTLSFEFSANSGAFKADDYDITLATPSQTIPLHAKAGTTDQIEVTVTFTEGKLYDLRLTGQPHQSGHPAFALHYEVRVANAPPANQTAGFLFICGAVFATLIIVLANVIMSRRKKL